LFKKFRLKFLDIKRETQSKKATMGLDDERAHLIDNVPSYQDAVSAPPYSHSSQRKLLEFFFSKL